MTEHPTQEVPICGPSLLDPPRGLTLDRLVLKQGKLVCGRVQADDEYLWKGSVEVSLINLLLLPWRVPVSSWVRRSGTQHTLCQPQQHGQGLTLWWQQ